MEKYTFETKLLDKAISGIKQLTLAELKAKKEMTWRLDNKFNNYVIATARTRGREIVISIDLDISSNGYSTTKNIGMSQYGGSLSRTNSEQKAFEDVQRMALQKLNIIKIKGII